MGMTEDEKKATLLKHEGYRKNPYKDTLGVLTGGIGHRMTREDVEEFDYNWSNTQKRRYWAEKYVKDYGTASTQAVAYMNEYGIEPRDETHFTLASMMFQMGKSGGHFPKMFRAIAEGNYKEAVKEMKTNSKGGPSKWYTQTPERVDELAQILESS